MSGLNEMIFGQFSNRIWRLHGNLFPHSCTVRKKLRNRSVWTSAIYLNQLSSDSSYDNEEPTKICLALDTKLLSLVAATMHYPVAPVWFLAQREYLWKLLFWNFFERTVTLQGSYRKLFLIHRSKSSSFLLIVTNLIERSVNSVLHKVTKNNRHFTFVYWQWSADSLKG